MNKDYISTKGCGLANSWNTRKVADMSSYMPFREATKALVSREDDIDKRGTVVESPATVSDLRSQGFGNNDEPIGMEDIAISLEDLQNMLEGYVDVMLNDPDNFTEEMKVIVTELLFVEEILLKDRFGPDYEKPMVQVQSKYPADIKCTVCGEVKSRTEFHLDRRCKGTRRTSACKSCRKVKRGAKK